MSLLKLARWTQHDLLRLAATEKRPQLLVIPYSHYCELAQFAVDASGTDYRRHAFAPGEHVLAALNLRVGREEKHLSRSARMDVMPRTAEEVGKERPKPRSNATAVPALVTEKVVLTDSWDILEACTGPLVLGDAFKKLMDERVAPLSRQRAYEFLFKPSNKNIWDGLCCHGRSPLFNAFWWAASDRLTDGMIKMFRTADADAMKLCDARLEEALDELDAMVEANAGPYLGGDAPASDDLALAALVGPLANPSEYVRGDYKALFDQMLAQDAECAERVEAWRERPSGKHALMVYAKHRCSPLEGAHGMQYR